MEQQLFKHSATGTVRTSQVEHSPGNGAVGCMLDLHSIQTLPYCGCGARRNVGAQDPCTSDQWVFQQSDIYRGDKCPLWDNLINLPRACMCCTCRCTIGSCCPFFLVFIKRVLHGITPSHIPWSPTISCWDPYVYPVFI